MSVFHVAVGAAIGASLASGNKSKDAPTFEIKKDIVKHVFKHTEAHKGEFAAIIIGAFLAAAAILLIGLIVWDSYHTKAYRKRFNESTVFRSLSTNEEWLLVGFISMFLIGISIMLIPLMTIGKMDPHEYIPESYWISSDGFHWDTQVPLSEAIKVLKGVK